MLRSCCWSEDLVGVSMVTSDVSRHAGGLAMSERVCVAVRVCVELAVQAADSAFAVEGHRLSLCPVQAGSHCWREAPPQPHLVPAVLPVPPQGSKGRGACRRHNLLGLCCKDMTNHQQVCMTKDCFGVFVLFFVF